MKIDYFGAYYSITELYNGTEYPHLAGAPILYGQPRLHFIKCAEYTEEGIQKYVFYIRLAKDYLEHDKYGEFMCDMTTMSVDDQTNIINFLNGSEDLSVFHPVTQQILDYDMKNNIPLEDIIETRTGIMSKEFLGFVPNHVFMINPELSEITEEIYTDEQKNEIILKIPKFNSGD